MTKIVTVIFHVEANTDIEAYMRVNNIFASLSIPEKIKIDSIEVKRIN